MLWFSALASVSLISLISLLGVLAIKVNKKTLDAVKFYLISLATGAMLGNAFVHLIPESFEHASSPTYVWLPMLSGFMSCFLLQKVLRLHCHNGPTGHCVDGNSHSFNHNHSEDHGNDGDKHIHPTGWMSILSHGIDNFTDGALIGTSFLLSYHAGIATTLAIVLHEIPMELGGFGILINANFKRWTAIGVNFASGLVAMLGTILTLWLGSEIHGVSAVLTPLAAGAVIYIVCVGLIPQVQDENNRVRSLKQLGMILLGLTIMILAKMIDPS